MSELIALLNVEDVSKSIAFYEAVLATIGMSKLVMHDTTVGFGKTYPEFWLNARPGMGRSGNDGGHVCLVGPAPDPRTAPPTTPPSSATPTATGSRS